MKTDIFKLTSPIRILLCILIGGFVITSCIPIDLFAPDNPENVEEGGENSGENENTGNGNEGEGGGTTDEKVKRPETLAEMLASIPQGYMEYQSFDEDGYDHKLGSGLFSNGAGWTPDGSLICLGGRYSNSILRLTMGNSFHELFKFDNVGYGFFKSEYTGNTTHQELLEQANSQITGNFVIMEQLWDMLNKYRRHNENWYDLKLEKREVEELVGHKVTHYSGTTDIYSGNIVLEYWVLDNGDCLKYKKTTTYNYTGTPKTEIDGMEITYWAKDLKTGYELFGAALSHNPSGGKNEYERIPVEKLTKYTDKWDKSLYPSVTDREWRDISYVGLGVDDLILPYSGSGKVVAMNIEQDSSHPFFGGVHTICVLVDGATKADAQAYINKINSIKYCRTISSSNGFDYYDTLSYEAESSACDADSCPSGHDPDVLPGVSHEIYYKIKWAESTTFYNMGAAAADTLESVLEMEDHLGGFVKIPAQNQYLVIEISLIKLGCWY